MWPAGSHANPAHGTPLSNIQSSKTGTAEHEAKREPLGAWGRVAMEAAKEATSERRGGEDRGRERPGHTARCLCETAAKETQTP